MSILEKIFGDLNKKEVKKLVQGEAARLAPDSGPSFLGLRLIGQFFALYLLCERAGQLVIIDQHAAHERILYGRMVQHYLAGQALGQALLFPETVELPPALQEVMIARQESVKALGFAVQAFGDNTWVIERVPALTSTLTRSEERRVGKECRSRWSPYH